MLPVDLNVHGVSLRFRACDPEAERTSLALQKDFGWFVTQTPLDEIKIEFNLHARTIEPAELDKARRALWYRGPLFKTRMCKVYGLGALRICDYGAGSVIIAKNSGERRRFEVFSQNPDELHENAYMASLSAVGEALDSRGFHRVHALGIENLANPVAPTAGLLIGPQGIGKSALGALLLARPDVRIYSDENPLVRRTRADPRIFPFPIRIALAETVARALGIRADLGTLRRKIFPAKCLISIPIDRVAETQSLSFVLIGRENPESSSPRITRTSRWAVFRALCKHLVIGVGLAQMAEHMIRLQRFPFMVQVAIKRLATAASIAAKCNCYEFTVSKDATVNLQTISDFLEETIN